MQTGVTKLLGIEHPIISAPMAPDRLPPLAAVLAMIGVAFETW